MYYYHPGAYTFASHPPPPLASPPPLPPARARTQSQPLLSPTLRNLGHRQTASVSRLDVSQFHGPRSTSLSPSLMPSEVPVARAPNRRNKARSLSLFLRNPADSALAPRPPSPPLPPLPHEARASWVGYPREQQRRSSSFSRPTQAPTVLALPPIPSVRRNTLDPARHQVIQHLPHDLQALRSGYLPTPPEVYSVYGELYEEQTSTELATTPLPTGIELLDPLVEKEHGGRERTGSMTRSDRDQIHGNSSQSSHQRGRESVGSSNTFGDSNDGIHQLLPSALPSTLPSPRERYTNDSIPSLSLLSLPSSVTTSAPVKTYQNDPFPAKDGNIGHDPDYSHDHPNNSCKRHLAQAHRTPTLQSNESNTIQQSSPGCLSQLPLAPERTLLGKASFEGDAGLPMHDTKTRTNTTATSTTTTTTTTTTKVGVAVTSAPCPERSSVLSSAVAPPPPLSSSSSSSSLVLVSTPEALAAAEPKTMATHRARALDGNENECTPAPPLLLQSLPLAHNESRNEVRTLQQQIQFMTTVLMHVVQRRTTPDAECLRAITGPDCASFSQGGRLESGVGYRDAKEPILSLLAALYCQDPWEYQARVIRQLELLQQRLFEAEKSAAWRMRRETAELERLQMKKSQQSQRALQWSNTLREILEKMVQESGMDGNNDTMEENDDDVDEGIEIGDHEAELELTCEEKPKSRVKTTSITRDERKARERNHVDHDNDNEDDREEVSFAKRTMFQRTFGIRVRPFVAKEKRQGEER